VKVVELMDIFGLKIDHLIFAAVLVILCFAGVVAIGTYGADFNMSDNTSEMAEIENQSSHYENKTCWIENVTKLTNKTYRDMTACTS